ncbi:substrate-binding domain-containing protein [Microbacterium invictum]|uniref:DNA-binding LacI/PurR family transcriptional regulator n=1 Tax=Microbacterium invictum TaxID=515415 RepID=A0AA40SQV1_9MICO|nr:LacI family DNA-binding transcriptional regulator [Microbacterium invictum]MBB4140577.1 DNA-binding LacI/PurR family transcriptional regulator [Microbacterium invictum]
MQPRRATIADVAREAGVAASTASVVFSGKTPVSDATRARVMAAAAALGYTGPDPRAASLRRGRSGIVGVVFEEQLGAAFLDPVKTLMMDGLTAAVAPLGAGLLLLHDHAVLPEPAPGGSDAEFTHPSLTTAPIDAAVLIGCSPRLRESLDVLSARGIPVVVIEADAGDGVPQILLDNREAQRAAAEHVRDLGHARVVAVTLPLSAKASPGWHAPGAAITVDVTRDRLAGVRDVFPDAAAYAAGGSSIDEGLAAGRVLFADPAARPTAVLAQSDLLAAGVIRAAEEAGLRVADDVSVTGFDGVRVDGLAPYELTTLVQDAAAKGRAAGEAIAAMLDAKPPASIRLTCTFRRGNTTGPVPESGETAASRPVE